TPNARASRPTTRLKIMLVFPASSLRLRPTDANCNSSTKDMHSPLHQHPCLHYIDGDLAVRVKAYMAADQQLAETYGDAEGWACKVILNVAGSGKFSSDRTIAEYAAAIWGAERVGRLAANPDFCL